MARQPLLVLLALMGFQWGQLAATARPLVDVVCCPLTKSYLETPRPPTALMTFPGSGNTWVRHIIETLTGYHTTSVYCDRALQPVFKAECDTSEHYNKSIVVKTHRLASCSNWTRAVVIIRDPLHAIRADISVSGHAAMQGMWTQRTATGMIGMQNLRGCVPDGDRPFAQVFGSEDQLGCADRPSSRYKVFFYEDLRTPSGDLNPYFLHDLLAWFKINKAESFYDCALKFDKGSFARQLPDDHSAAKVLSDTKTLRQFWAAGCTQAFSSYTSRFKHLPQPVPKTYHSIVHTEQ